MQVPRRSLATTSLITLAFASIACTDRLGPETDHTTGDAARGPGGSAAYESATLGTLGGESGVALGINNRNWVVGVAENEAGQPRAFLWRDGHIEELPGLGGSFSGANAISNGGLIVGAAETAEGEVRAVLWRRGQPEDLGTLGGTFSSARAVNARGQVIGVSTRADGERRPFLWWRGEMQELPLPPAGEVFRADAFGINERGHVVGQWIADVTDHFEKGLIWIGGQVSVLPSPCHEYGAWDINARGMIVGGGLGCPLSPFEIGPIFWPRPSAESENLEPLGGFGDLEMLITLIGNALAVNNRGQVAGWSEAGEPTVDRDIRATLWERGEPIDLSGEPDVTVTVTDVNDRSVVVGGSQGLPVLFVPRSERGLLAAGRARAIAPDARRGPGPRAARQAPAPGVLPGMGLREGLVGTRADAAWAAELCASTPRLRPAPLVSEILAGCP